MKVTITFDDDITIINEHLSIGESYSFVPDLFVNIQEDDKRLDSVHIELKERKKNERA